jgi:hypothetical protein
MSTLLVALILALVLGVVVFLLTYTLNRIAGQVTRHFNARFRAADEIINQDRVPEDWIKEHHRKIQQAESKGRGEAEIERLGRRAKNDVIKRIKRLRKFLDSGNYYDSLKTKEMVLETLYEQEQRWSEDHWQDLLAMPLSSSATGGKEQDNAANSD